MAHQAIQYIIPYALSAMACLWVAILAFLRTGQPGAGAYGMMALFQVEWILAYIFQMVTPDLQGKLFWNNLQFVGAVAVPLAYCAFCMDYSGTKHRHPRVLQSISLLAGALVLGLIFSDGLHHLFRVDPHVVPSFPFSILVFTNGPAFPIYTIYAYLLVIAGSYALVNNYFSAPSAYRFQVATILVGILIPWITTIVTWLSIIPLRLHDTTPLSFGVSNLVIAWALFRYQLFDIVPVAYHVLFEGMDDGVIVLDHLLRILDMNPAAQRILGQPLAKALGKPMAGRMLTIEAAMKGLDEEQVNHREISLMVDSHQRHYEIRLIPLADNRGVASGRLILLHDVTVRWLAEQELQRRAITDSLTGLLNRRRFFELAEMEFERASRSGNPLGLIIFDVDHFKSINDTYGHQAGDEVLKGLASRCMEALRGYDILARYGGEEFIIALPETNLDQAVGVGERLRASIADEPFLTSNGRILATISLGVAYYNHDEWLTLEQLINHADQALYGAKASARNLVAVWRDGKIGAIAPILPMFERES